MWLDIILLVIIVSSIIIDVLRGGIRGIFGLLGIIIGIFGASRIYKSFALSLPIQNPSIARAVSFIILFLVIAVLINLIGLGIRKAAHFLSIGFLDRFLGLILGALKGTLLAGAICFFLNLFPQGQNVIQSSKIAPTIFAELRFFHNLFPKTAQQKLHWRTPRQRIRLKSAQTLRRTSTASQSSIDSIF